MDDDLLPLHSQLPARTLIRPWLGRGQPIGAYMMIWKMTGISNPFSVHTKGFRELLHLKQ
jgi:hypothetical protein